MKKNRASIGSDVIENILRIYPQLNVVWLLTGKGSMLKEESDDLPLDFDLLPKDKQREIEAIIEQKIREKQRGELERLMEEIRSELRK
jgi:hypothetical protein